MHIPADRFFPGKMTDTGQFQKGEPNDNEDLLIAAKREFEEETGIKPENEFIELGSITQKGGKEVFGWAFEGNLPAEYRHTCNTVRLEWPPAPASFRNFRKLIK